MENLEKILADFEAGLKNLKSEREVFDFEKRYLGRKDGIITNLFSEIANLSIDEKRELGSKLNEIKKRIKVLLKQKKSSVSKIEIEIDEDAPEIKSGFGSFHPLTIIKKELAEVFSSMGFDIVEGFEVANDYYNFGALNFPEDHPARDMQDAYYISGSKDQLLRAHTSTMQVFTFENEIPPVRKIAMGKCFRRDETDATHEHTFWQIEGFAVDENITSENLKFTLNEMFKKILGKEDVNVRFRPSYFPFVEPGYEVDSTCTFCGGKGCRICKNTGWIEWGGAGMIHPNVLEKQNIDSKKFRGFAFGFGIERMAMIKFGIKEIRNFHSGDLRFLGV